MTLKKAGEAERIAALNRRMEKREEEKKRRKDPRPLGWLFNEDMGRCLRDAIHAFGTVMGKRMMRAYMARTSDKGSESGGSSCLRLSEVFLSFNAPARNTGPESCPQEKPVERSPQPAFLPSVLAR